MSEVGSVITARIAEIDEELAKHQPLVDEKKGLEKALKAISGSNGAGSSNGGSTPKPAAVSNEAIVDVVNKADGTISTQEVADALGVGTRNVARKLKSLADKGEIAGNKDDGWKAA
jgi:hypothetical protein